MAPLDTLGISISNLSVFVVDVVGCEVGLPTADESSGPQVGDLSPYLEAAVLLNRSSL